MKCEIVDVERSRGSRSVTGVIDSTIDVIGTRKVWRYSPVAAAVLVVAAVDHLLNRKIPSLPGNGASRIGCEKESLADSLGSEYRQRDLRNGN